MDNLFVNCVECFELDLEIYNNIFKKAPRIRKNVEQYKNVLETFESLSEDIYLALFKANPLIRRSEEIKIKYRLNHVIINKICQTDEFQMLRKSCSLKHFNSILAAELLGSEIANRYKLLLENNEDFAYQLKRFEDIKMENQESEIIMKKIDKIIDNIGIIISNDNLIYKSVSSSYKEFLSTTNTIKSWGLDDGKLTPTSYEEKVEVSVKLRKLKRIREISEMAGRFKASASKLQRKKTKEEGQEVCGVQLGNEIHKILPSEKLLLTKEATKKSFYKKYTQKELLSYKHKNNR